MRATVREIATQPRLAGSDIEPMRTLKRSKRQKQAGEWGVVEARSEGAFGHGCPVWLAYWMELGGPGRVSIEIDPDPAQNISPATWGRARRAFGLPERILVLDQETADRVRRVVPRRVEIVVAAGDLRLQRMATAYGRDEDDPELDLVPFPAPRARC
jgi:hypothetical protein